VIQKATILANVSLAGFVVVAKGMQRLWVAVKNMV